LFWQPKEVGGFLTDKVGPQFSSTDSKKQTIRNQGVWLRWRREGSLDEDTVSITDIPEQ
jgi:hypothetical protein